MAKNILLVILAVALGWFAHLALGPRDTAVAAKQSTFDRVMETHTIRCAYAPWPPFLIKDANTGQLSGFNYDIFNEIGRELGMKIDWVEEVGYGNFIEGLNTDRYDAMCATAWPDAGRFTNSTATLPAHYHKVYVVVRADDARFADGYAKLNDPAFKVSVIESDITETIGKTDFPKATMVRLPQSADASQLFMDVASGKADATFVDWGFFNNYNKTNPGVLKPAGNVLRVFGSVFYVKSGEMHLKALIDGALIALTNYGKINEILRRYETTAMAPAPMYIDATKQ